jgi:vacuolar-type H+-ATPase catalytic subunit A/Vma1
MRSNSERFCEMSVTMPVSCGRGESSEKITSSPFTKNSTPNRPWPPRSSTTLRAMSSAAARAAADIGVGCQLSR